MYVPAFQFPPTLPRRIGLIALSVFFVIAGINHFLNPFFYVKIMPPYLPAHLELVYISGFFEILGGLGVLLPRIRSLAGWGLILLLMAVFPANLHMAIFPEQYPAVPAVALYVRLPLQLLFIAWAYWATRPGGTGE
jgi:uncharacterized membrane protein